MKIHDLTKRECYGCFGDDRLHADVHVGDHAIALIHNYDIINNKLDGDYIKRKFNIIFVDEPSDNYHYNVYLVEHKVFVRLYVDGNEGNFKIEYTLSKFRKFGNLVPDISNWKLYKDNWGMRN